MPSESDRLLVQQIRRGDSGAWEDADFPLRGPAVGLRRTAAARPGASEDVVQETFVGFLNSLPNFDDRRELQTYLFTIAAHKLTDHLRRTGRHPLRPLDSSNRPSHQQLDSSRRPPAWPAARNVANWKTMPSPAAWARSSAVARQGRPDAAEGAGAVVGQGLGQPRRGRLPGVSEQQVANYRFAAVKKLTEHISDAGLSVRSSPNCTTPATTSRELARNPPPNPLPKAERGRRGCLSPPLRFGEGVGGGVPQ